ncbi:MAG: hypothetical protein NXI23_16500 [Bacteroidetes bacterium]|jgi:hypothetical protein|nr:hypothetical protein [Bacteroidota bacterium]
MILKNTVFIFGLCLLPIFSFSQIDVSWIQYEPNPAKPYGDLNPNAPEQVADFRPMIGQSECKSVSRNPDGSWQDTVDMLWQFKYIMNGTAVQDEVWRGNDLFAGSIRQYHADSAQWVVSYFSYPSVPYTPNVWHGNKKDNEIILTKPQKAPNGMNGSSTLTFYDINFYEFKWKGAWVSEDGTTEYPFWMIDCKKRE